LVQELDQFSRCHRTVCVFADGVDVVPIEACIEADTDPAPMTHVRRLEEMIGLLLDQLELSPRRCGAPQVRKFVCVVTVEPGVDESRFVAHEEARSAVTEPFGCFGKRKTDLPQLFERPIGVFGQGRWEISRS
jgi:hypothetical protein